MLLCSWGCLKKGFNSSELKAKHFLLETKVGHGDVARGMETVSKGLWGHSAYQEASKVILQGSWHPPLLYHSVLLYLEINPRPPDRHGSWPWTNTSWATSPIRHQWRIWFKNRLFLNTDNSLYESLNWKLKKFTRILRKCRIMFVFSFQFDLSCL